MLTDDYTRERSDTIHCIMANLVSNDGVLKLSDEEDSTIEPIKEVLETADDYSDPKWVPEPNDAEPGYFIHYLPGMTGTLRTLRISRFPHQQARRYHQHSYQYLRLKRSVCQRAADLTW